MVLPHDLVQLFLLVFRKRILKMLVLYYNNILHLIQMQNILQSILDISNTDISKYPYIKEYISDTLPVFIYVATSFTSTTDISK